MIHLLKKPHRIKSVRHKIHLQSGFLQQHKSLLLFVGKKVIVAKVKLCSNRNSDHGGPPDALAFPKYSTHGQILQEKFCFCEKNNNPLRKETSHRETLVGCRFVTG